MKIFAERLKELRIEKGISQTTLAKDTKLSQSSIAYWENEKREPTLESAKILAQYFKVSTDYLCGLED